MKRWLAGISVAGLLLVGIGAAGQVELTDRELLIAIHDLLHDHGIPTSDSTTTTSTASTTTTTTTTTTAPTTTTTAASEIPPYVDLGRPRLGEGYTIQLSQIDDPNTAQVEPTEKWWDAPYWYILPYEPGYGWASGDRCGYRGAYGPLVVGGTVTQVDSRRWDLIGGTPIATFAVSRVGDQGYARVNDEFMLEGVRHYDGSPSGFTSPHELGECPVPSESYEVGAGLVAPLVFYYDALHPDALVEAIIEDGLPTVLFWHNGVLVEQRPYRVIEPGVPDLTWQLVESADHDVAVLASVDAP